MKADLTKGIEAIIDEVVFKKFPKDGSKNHPFYLINILVHKAKIITLQFQFYLRRLK